MNATYEAVKERLERMRLEDIQPYIKDWQEVYADEGGMPECVRRAIEDDLMGRAAYCARMLDMVKEIEPLKRSANSPALGTPNKRSTTYKVRKALGYSYP